MADSFRRCARCQKPLEKTGRIVDGMPICSSCAPQFNPIVQCPRCGKDARIFGHDKETGHRVCQRCLQKKTHATCSLCGKYRKRIGSTEDGKPLCRNCEANPHASHRCPSCHCKVPGVGRSLCERCAITRRYKNARREIQREFRTDWGRHLFNAYCTDDSFDVGASTVVPRLRQMSAQIVELEERFPSLHHLNQEALLKAYGVEGCRRRQKVIAALQRFAGLEWSTASSEAFNETRRLEAVIADANETGHREEVERFISSLDVELAPKTRRVYARTALKFFRMQHDRPLSTVDQNRIEGFVRQFPGHRASLAPLLNYLRNEHKAPVPSQRSRKSPALRTRDRHLRDRTRQISQLIEETTDIRQGRGLLAALLSALYGCPLSEVLNIRANSIRERRGAKFLTICGSEYRLSSVVGGYVDRFANTFGRDPMFPGRPSTRPMTPSSVYYHLKKHGVATTRVQSRSQR